MSSRTNPRCAAARSTMRTTLRRQSSSSMSKPIWVSFTDTFTSSPPRAAISSTIRTYCSAAASASAPCVTLSPRRSRLEVICFFASVSAAETASVMVSPATKREANCRATPFERTKLKTFFCSDSHSRPWRIMRCLPSAE